MLAAPPAPSAARRLLLGPGSPGPAQHDVGLAGGSGQEGGDLPAGGLKLRVGRRARGGRCGRVQARPRGGGDLLGHALDVRLRQRAGRAGADEARLLADIVAKLPDAGLGGGPEGGDLR